MQGHTAAIETASAILTDNYGRFLFQLRDEIPDILYPGLIGLFGGHMETGETPLQAICRELHEEVGIAVAPDAFSILTKCSVPVPSDMRLMETVFHATGIPVDRIEVTEGRLLPLEFEDLPAHLGKMTPITCCAVRILMDRI